MAEVGHEHVVAGDIADGIGSIGGHYLVALRPVGKDVAIVGCCGEGGRGARTVGACTGNATAGSRIGRGGDGVAVDVVGHINGHVLCRHGAAHRCLVRCVARDGGRCNAVGCAVVHSLGVGCSSLCAASVSVVDSQRVAVDVVGHINGHVLCRHGAAHRCLVRCVARDGGRCNAVGCAVVHSLGVGCSSLCAASVSVVDSQRVAVDVVGHINGHVLCRHGAAHRCLVRCVARDGGRCNAVGCAVVHSLGVGCSSLCAASVSVVDSQRVAVDVVGHINGHVLCRHGAAHRCLVRCVARDGGRCNAVGCAVVHSLGVGCSSLCAASVSVVDSQRVAVDVVGHINGHVLCRHGAAHRCLVRCVARDGGRCNAVGCAVVHSLGVGFSRLTVVGIVVVDGQGVAVDGPVAGHGHVFIGHGRYLAAPSAEGVACQGRYCGGGNRRAIVVSGLCGNRGCAGRHGAGVGVGDIVAVECEVGHHVMICIHGDGGGIARYRTAINGPVLEGVSRAGCGGELYAGTIVVSTTIAHRTAGYRTAVARTDRGGEDGFVDGNLNRIADGCTATVCCIITEEVTILSESYCCSRIKGGVVAVLCGANLPALCRHG